MSQQIDFDFNRPPLPLPERLPTNLESRKVGDLVRQDFEASAHYLIVTGFSSLEYLLRFFKKAFPEKHQHTRILLGHEDLRPDRVRSLRGQKLSQEIVDYWLDQGISPIHCSAALQLVDLIESGQVEFRILQNLHAKLYLGETHAILGSSNFSYHGMVKQLEANLRIGKAKDEKRYEEIRQIGAYYWEQGTPFNEKIIELLRQLLNKVGWREALARSAALLIEGDWWKSFRQMEWALQGFRMWPSQEIGLGKALYILGNHGSVLIADPTGSGKTRMGAALHLALKYRLLASGHHPDANELLLSPPRVMDHWEQEYLKAGSNFNSIVSHGILSSGSASVKKRSLQRLHNAKILIVDEAHNFINKMSNRSREIAKSLAEHTILFTATPINRKVEDLFRLIDLLDIDNFPDRVIELYKKYAFRRSQMTQAERMEFRSVLNHFVVRRTKKELNALIDKSPGSYRNALEVNCRYPRQIEEVYDLNESPKDVTIASRINALADQLRGISRLQSLGHPRQRWMKQEEQEAYLNLRIKASAALARYMVQNMMRSSGAALLEHVLGTETAAAFYQLPDLPADKESGNMIGKVRALMDKLPQTNLSQVQLPLWLREEKAYRNACEKEIRLYQEIADLCRQMSIGRERRKASFLGELLNKHSLVIGFDHRIISLYVFQKHLQKAEIRNLLVTGSSKTSLDKAKEAFRLGSSEKGLIGLFSDSMSEGVNLQGASALVMLDMPSVVRLAEQRIGRIDRMDSPYPEVSLYWPNDQEAFALKTTDERFFRTARDVEQLIGGNFTIPDQLKTIRAQDAIRIRKEAQKEEEQAMEELLPDAFQAVEDLVFGERALISVRDYEALKSSTARVLSNVSIVRSRSSWAFFALRGTAEAAPCWLFLEADGKVSQELTTICARLREELPLCQDLEEWGEADTRAFDQFLSHLQNSRVGQLPLKKQRAILLLQKVLDRELKTNDLTLERKSLIHALKRALSFDDGEYTTDLDHFGQELIRYFQPMLQELRMKSLRRVYTLQSLYQPLKQQPPSDEQL